MLKIWSRSQGGTATLTKALIVGGNRAFPSDVQQTEIAVVVEAFRLVVATLSQQLSRDDDSGESRAQRLAASARNGSRDLHFSTALLNLTRLVAETQTNHPRYLATSAHVEPKVDECKPWHALLLESLLSRDGSAICWFTRAPLCPAVRWRRGDRPSQSSTCRRR